MKADNVARDPEAQRVGAECLDLVQSTLSACLARLHAGEGQAMDHAQRQRVMQALEGLWARRHALSRALRRATPVRRQRLGDDEADWELVEEQVVELEVLAGNAALRLLHAVESEWQALQWRSRRQRALDRPAWPPGPTQCAAGLRAAAELSCRDHDVRLAVMELAAGAFLPAYAELLKRRLTGGPSANVASPPAVAATPAARIVAPATRVVAPAARIVAPAARIVAPAARVVAPAARVVAPAARIVAPAAPVVAPAARIVAPAARGVAPTAPVVVPAAPVAMPTAPVVAPAAPVAMPAAPVAVPTAPVVAPAAPVAMPAAPVVAPATPVAMPAAPVVAPVGPVAMPTAPVVASAAPDVPPEAIADSGAGAVAMLDAASPGATFRMVLHEKWALARLAWRSSNGQYFMFTSNVGGRAHSLSRSSLTAMIERGHLHSMPPEHMFHAQAEAAR